MPAPNVPGNRSPQPMQRPQGAAQQSALPSVKYFNESGKLRPELLDDEAMAVGEALANAGLESAQLRRFYGDVVSLRRRFEIRSAGAPLNERASLFADILPEFRLLRAKAYYANRRSEKILPKVMKDFIQQHVDAVHSWQDFLAFCRHFEAVVAFHYAFSKK